MRTKFLILLKNPKLYLGIFIFIGIVLGIMTPRPTRAVIPPDFIFNIGSNLVQIFSIVVLFFSTVIGVSYRFLKVRFAGLFRNPVFWIFTTLIIIAGSVGLAFTFASARQRSELASWIQRYQLDHVGKIEEQYYFYDRFILSGTVENKPFLMIFEGSRHQADSIYGHYYLAEAVYNGQVYHDYAVFNHSSSQLVPQGFLQQVSFVKPSEFPDEAYTLQIVLEGTTFDIAIKNIHADFLVKNDLEYIRYASAADAEIEVKGKKYPVNVMTDKILSTDGRVPMVAGYPDLHYTSNSIVLWDEEGNFYHIDISDVKTPDAPYKSHSWILFKDKETGLMKKVFSGSASSTKEGDKRGWDISIPELDEAKIKLHVTTFTALESNTFSGIVEGAIQDTRGNGTVRGYGFYNDVK